MIQAPRLGPWAWTELEQAGLGGRRLASEDALKPFASGLSPAQPFPAQLDPGEQMGSQEADPSPSPSPPPPSSPSLLLPLPSGLEQRVVPARRGSPAGWEGRLLGDTCGWT